MVEKRNKKNTLHLILFHTLNGKWNRCMVLLSLFSTIFLYQINLLYSRNGTVYRRSPSFLLIFAPLLPLEAEGHSTLSLQQYLCLNCTIVRRMTQAANRDSFEQAYRGLSHNEDVGPFQHRNSFDPSLTKLGCEYVRLFDATLLTMEKLKASSLSAFYDLNRSLSPGKDGQVLKHCTVGT